ncbi:MAG: response regulator transcription factor [Myxococcales bacterium]|nr:response regulator transcription factor [Myxococcales bacterium]
MRRVLVCDDSPVARAAVEKKLRAHGADVVLCASAAEARATTTDGLTCALLDVDLGDGLGTDVAAALRRAAPALPVAFFTSEPDVTNALGPVFRKPDGLDAAVAWALAAGAG